MHKTILITGAGTGIGKDTTIALAKNGHQVIATTETQLQTENLQLELNYLKLAVKVFELEITVSTTYLL